uniref:KIB1-4 beta-propeller domain-containing protein n=1 Tax=Oryza glaberrima TaxID=4538 RepID=I1PC70_ORYGL
MAARTRPQAQGLDLPLARALVRLDAPPHPRHRRCRASSRPVPPHAVTSPVVVARGGPGVAFSFDGLCDLILLMAIVVDISNSGATVAVLYRREREFAIARTGERSWRLINNKLDRIVDMARHGDGKLYTVHLSGKVARWKFNYNVCRSPKILESVLVIDSPYHYVVKADGDGNAIIMSREYEHDHRDRASECCYLAEAPRGTLYLLKRVYKHKQGGGGGGGGTSSPGVIRMTTIVGGVVIDPSSHHATIRSSPIPHLSIMPPPATGTPRTRRPPIPHANKINQRKQWQMALGVQWQVCTNKIMCYDYANSCHMTHLQTHLNGGEQWHFPYRFHDNRAEFWHHVTMNSLQWLLWLLLRLVPFLCPDAVRTKNFMEGTLLQYGGHEELQMVHEMELLTPYC